MDSRLLILDAGSGNTKMGWSTDPNPQEVYPSVVGRPKLIGDDAANSEDIKEIMVGHQAWKARKFLDLKYPIENGIVKDWDDCVHLWKYGFDELKVKPSSSAVLVTEPVRNSDEARSKLAELIFEKFGFNAMQIQIQAILSMYSEGKRTATVLDSGDGVTNVIPIFDNYILNNQIKRSNLAGKEITKQMIKLLFLRGYAFNSSADFETVKEIKEKLGFISHNISLDRKIAHETVFYEQDYLLPDGTLVKLGRERFEASEILFDPKMVEFSTDGLGTMVFEAIRGSDATVRLQLYKNILLSGGTTMLPGFPDRLKADVIHSWKTYVRKNPDTDVKAPVEIIAPPRRHINVFSGACVFAKTLTKASSELITKKEYEESGNIIIKKKAWSNTAIAK